MFVLLVDLDDTLIPDVSARDHALSHVLAAGGSRYSPESATAFIRACWHACDLRDTPATLGVSSWEALWTTFAAADAADQAAAAHFHASVWQELLPELGTDEAVASFRTTREALVVPYGWVPLRLAELADDFALWCVTNGSSELQRRKLELSGLDEMFAEVVVSGEVGAVKSSREYVEHVRRRLFRRSARAVAVVGDRADSDGRFASGLGVPFFQLDSGDPIPPLRWIVGL